MRKVYLNPPAKPFSKLGSGVDVVIYQMHKFLPLTGISLVDNVHDADVIATHISSPDGRYVDVLHCHGLYPTAYSTAEKWQSKINETVVHAARSAYMVTVPSRWVAELFQRDMGFTPAIVPHALDLAEWPERTQAPIKHSVLWNKNRDTDVCDPSPVVELAKAVPGMTFVSTFGEAQRNLSITGPMPFGDMQKLLYQASIYFAPTKETFGIGILEAMVSGLPVLGWRWGSLPDLVEHKVTGYIANPYDYEDTQVGLKFIQEHWAEMAKTARVKALTFSWDAVCRQYAAVYEKAYERKQAEKRGGVSFVIPCYNYAKYVGQAIQSVKDQVEGTFECIVVDDGSTDASVEVIENEIKDDKRFKLVKQANAGVATARNTGAMQAKYPFLCFLDADDRLQPHFITSLLPVLKQKRELGIVYGKLNLMNEDGVVHTQASAWPGAYSASDQLQRKNQVPSCCLMRTSIFFRTGGFRQHTAPTEDAELWSRFPLLGYNAALATPKAVYDYRMHANSASSTVRGQKEPDWLAWIPSVFGGQVPFASTTSVNNTAPAVMDYDEPLLSVITPVGPKHAQLVRDAIESVAGQTDPRWEHIVVDDTEDGRLAEVGALPYYAAYPWVKWVRNDKRGNVSAARNLGVSASRGRFIVFLDADDFLYRDYVKVVLDTLTHCQEDSRLVYSDWVSLPNGEVHRAENWNLDRLKQYALFAVTFAHPRKAFDTIGGFDESMELWEDWDYVVRLALAGYSGIRVTQPLFAYRYDTGERREDSLKNKDQLMRAMRAKYEVAIPTRRKT